jgi:2-oxoacid:acceptor oxidoreductase gamma subunit (pyruvate/2-ketoisovalerate family)
MYEIRFHGRGGQGIVFASEILATAFFYENKYVSSYPYFGVERRGAPVTAFTRVDDQPVLIKSQIYAPDFVIVLDQTLLSQVNVTAGLKKEGAILINSSKNPEFFKYGGSVATVNATEIALSHNLGSSSAPIVNTAIVGAFAKATNTVSIDSVAKAIKDKIDISPDENVKAAIEAYENTKIKREVN